MENVEVTTLPKVTLKKSIALTVAETIRLPPSCEHQVIEIGKSESRGKVTMWIPLRKVRETTRPATANVPLRNISCIYGRWSIGSEKPKQKVRHH